MKKILFVLTAVAAACAFQIAGFQTIANAEWGGDNLVTNHIPDCYSAKPSMDKAPNGDLYIAVEEDCGIDQPNSIRVYKSTDGGKTWGWVINIYSDTSSYYSPSLAYAEGSENWVFITFERTEGVDLRSIVVFRFDPANPLNNYQTTIAYVEIHPELTSRHIKPEICTDTPYYVSNYYVYVTYSVLDFRHDEMYETYFTRSLDRGLTWSTPVNVTGTSGTNWYLETKPDIAYGPSGLYIALEKKAWNGSEDTNQVYVTKSTDYGLSWNTPFPLNPAALNPTYEPRVAVASNGTVMVAYAVEYGFNDTDIESSYSTDGGTNWYPLYPPYTTDYEWNVELSASTSNGRFHAAYYHDYRDIWYSWAYTTNPELGWSSAIVVNELNANDWYYRPAMCSNPTLPVDQEACVAWTDTRNGIDDVYFDQPSTCGNGVLEGGEDCDDGNTLNGDCCSAECTFEPYGSPCDNPDSTDCSTPDTCTGDGFCSANDYPEGTQCTDDGNMCTDDACNGYGICLHYPNTDPCDDGNACTIADSCSNWSCVSGTALNCDDGNVCTNDSCNPASGCIYTNNADSCNDGLFCNGYDTCAGGTCSVHAGDPCFPVLCDEITNTCSGGSDFDGDGVPDSLDNCTYQYNPGQEDIDSDGMGDACDNCPRLYNQYQEDTYPPQTNGCGDACECEGNFNGWEDQDVDGSDAFIFKTDFGRSRILNPCTNADPCNGDFFCEADVDGTDAFVFKSDFGRSSILNPCPYCVTIPWCNY